MSNSWRHHYIPIFYLKGFTDDLGKFYVYNKKKGRMVKKSQSPRSYFYIENRHTLLDLSNNYDDFIETSLYKSFDDLTSSAINDLLKYPITNFDNDLIRLSKIVMFINGLIYRIPKYDNYHNKKIDDGDKEYLLPIYDKNRNDVSYPFYQRNKKLELYKYACRFFCSIKQSVPVPDEAKNWTIFSLPNDYNSKYYLLSGDSPVLVNDISLFKTSDELVIAPLTKKHFIIRSKYKIDNNKDVFQLLHLLNIGIIIGSLEYICSPDKTFLENYIKWSAGYTEDYIWKELKGYFINNK